MKHIILALAVSFSPYLLGATGEGDHLGDYSPLKNGIAHGMGIGGSVYRTWGFSYRRYFVNDIGLSTSLGGWLTGTYGHVGNSIGISYSVAHHSFSWPFLPKSSVRVYLIGYLANIFGREEDLMLPGQPNGSGAISFTNSYSLGIGVGPGAEFFFSPNFGVHLELPWMTFFKTNKKKLAFRDSYPHIGGGLSYYF